MSFFRPILFFILVFINYVTFAQSVSIRVQGEGDTFYAAQMEASRRAMMLVLPQLVSVDRLTINQEITNTILSSVAGYIEKFEVIRESRNNNQVLIDANIIISTQAIKQFNSLLRSDGSFSLSGSSVMAEFTREETQSKFLNNYLTRSFRGIPNSAIDFKIIKLERDSNSNSQVSIYIEGKFRPEFLESLASSLNAINCSAMRDTKNCNLSLLINKHSKGKSFFGREKDDWDIKRIDISSNPPNSYDMLRLILRSADRRDYYTVNWQLTGRILFKDSLNQFIQDPIDPRFLAGLEFNFGLPITLNCPGKNCDIGLSGKSFTVRVPFDPKSFGETFNKVASMEISSYVNRNFDYLSRRGNDPQRAYNIICNDLVDYLQIHLKNDIELSDNRASLPQGCKTGYYHATERTIRNTVQY